MLLVSNVAKAVKSGTYYESCNLLVLYSTLTVTKLCFIFCSTNSQMTYYTLITLGA